MSTFAACLYLGVSLTAQDARLPMLETVPYSLTYNGIVGTGTYQRWTDSAVNPYVRASLGCSLDYKQITAAFEGFHESSIATGQDRGINGITFKLNWFPFKR